MVFRDLTHMLMSISEYVHNNPEIPVIPADNQHGSMIGYAAQSDEIWGFWEIGLQNVHVGFMCPFWSDLLSSPGVSGLLDF